MPRVSRKSLNSNYFHVIVQGIEKKCVFESKEYKEKYKELLIENAKKNDIKLLVYCIMDNHAHMLIYSEKIEELSRFMQKINTSFAIYFNKINKRVGYLFRSRFRCVEIKSEKQLERTMTYIHLNPVKAKICASPELYDFSSYNDYVMKRGIATEENLKLLNLDIPNYIDVFKFKHYLNVDGDEFTNELREERIHNRIDEYVKENNIIDYIFQSDKVKKMILDLEKEQISFSKIANYFGITKKRLEEIIED